MCSDSHVVNMEDSIPSNLAVRDSEDTQAQQHRDASLHASIQQLSIHGAML